MTLRLYWVGLYEDSNKWESFFQVDLSPAFIYCAKRMLGESEHTYITGCVALVLMNELTVLSMFTLNRLAVVLLLNPLTFPLLLYLLQQRSQDPSDFPMVFWFALGLIQSLIVELIWSRVCRRVVCAIASSLDMTLPAHLLS